MSKQVSLPIGNKDVEDLLLWRDPKKSGIVFAGATLAYLLLEWSHFSLLSIIANTLLIAVSVAFLWNNIANFTGRPGVPVPDVVRHGVSDSQVKAGAERVTTILNKLLAFANRVFTGKEVVLSAQVAAALFLIAKVGNWFTSLGLLYTVVVLAFTIPKAYELKKDEIDNFAAKAHHHGKAAYSKHVEPYVNKIPRASTSTSAAPKPAAVDSTADSKPVSAEVKKAI